MKNSYLHIASALILVVLLFIVTDVFMIWMPSMLSTILLLTAAVLLSVWVGLVHHEQAHDEREALHRMYAGRIAYLSGIIVLSVALLVQGLMGDVNVWIASALGVMVLSKSLARIFLDTYR